MISPKKIAHLAINNNHPLALKFILKFIVRFS